MVELDGDYETDLYSYMTQAAPGGGERTTQVNWPALAHQGCPWGRHPLHGHQEGVARCEFAYYSFFTINWTM